MAKKISRVRVRVRVKIRVYTRVPSMYSPRVYISGFIPFPLDSSWHVLNNIGDRHHKST